MHPALPSLFQSLRHNLAGHAGGFDVHLDGRNTLHRSSNLEIHIAQMILYAEDIGQYGDPLPFRDESHGNAGNRRLDRHPRIHEGKRAATHRRHG